MNKETRTCQNCKTNFVIDPDDINFYKKIDVPWPTFCPECRLIRRLGFRNDRTLYRRKCMLCGSDIITIYHPDKPYVVYCQQCWWSDKWSPFAHGQEYNFSKPFFEQYAKLLTRVPLMANFVVNDKTMENSPFNNMVSYLKNCYLLTDADYNENCAYGCEVENSKDCYDSNLIDRCELCFECINCQNCYRTMYSVDCEGCHDVWFSQNMMNCSNCVGCVNLRGKQYFIFNRPYTKEGYEDEVKTLKLSSHKSIKDLKERAASMLKLFPQKYAHGLHNTNASGEYINNSKNTHNSWLVMGCEDVRYSQYLVAKGTKDAYDYTQFGDGAELFYENLQSGDHGMRIKFTWFVHRSTDVEYSIQCMSSQNLFGCVGIRNENNCILNKKYTEPEYADLVLKIKDQMDALPFGGVCGRQYKYGEFFPFEISPFGYNETTAQQYFPLSKGVARERGYSWQEIEERNYTITKPTSALPDTVEDVGENILQEIIECEHGGLCEEQCTKAFRIIPQELQFYKQFSIPLPRLCPNCRHYARLQFRNPPRFWHGPCQCAGKTSQNNVYTNLSEHFHGNTDCPNEFATSYDPNRLTIVYCEQCYQAEVA